MAKMKRVLIVGLVLLVAIAFGVGAQAKLVKAAFVISNAANESQAFSSKQFLKFGSQYGFDMYTFDAKGDTQAESQIVTNCIAQKFKVIFLNPNDISAIVPAIIKAKAAGMIVGMFSSDLAPENQKYRDFYAGVNDTMAGQQAAQAFKKALPERRQDRGDRRPGGSRRPDQATRWIQRRPGDQGFEYPGPRLQGLPAVGDRPGAGHHGR